MGGYHGAADRPKGRLASRGHSQKEQDSADQPCTFRKGTNMATQRIASGRTTPGSTNWQVYSPTGIMVNVDTTSGKFSSVPVYITSIGGNSSHWATTGATSVYLPTTTGFRVYVKWSDNSPLTPAQANSFQWHINWIGMEL